jgi:signal transduction histidine kinase
MARRIVEKDFGGLLIATSEAGRGSSFKASLPMRKKEYAT